MKSPAMMRWKLVPVEATEGMLAVIDTLHPPFGTPEQLTEEYCNSWRRRHRKAAYCTWGALADHAPEPDWVDYAMALLDCLADEGADSAFHNPAHPQHALFMAAFDAIHAHEAREAADD